jgi:hypothetical protein
MRHLVNDASACKERMRHLVNDAWASKKDMDWGYPKSMAVGQVSIPAD